MNEDQHIDTARAIDILHDVLVGTTAKNLMCPSCGYLKEKNIRNADRPYVVVVWQCPCGRLNHTKVATEQPELGNVDINIKIGKQDD